MCTKIELPKAFSVWDEHEFLPIQHLMARLNPRLLVKPIAEKAGNSITTTCLHSRRQFLRSWR